MPQKKGARDRIRELEGEAAALKSEADGKARGQSDLQTRSLTLTQELSQLTAGLAALEQCSDWPEKARALLASERPALSDGLTALGLEVVPGQANYLLFRAAGAADLKERMLMRGVLIRSCANYPGLGPGYYRVAVRTRRENQVLLSELKEVL